MSSLLHLSPEVQREPETLYIASVGREVTISYEYRDLAWNEAGLEGEIPNVLVGVDASTDQILVYPPEATQAIKMWRDKVIETRDVVEKKREKEEIAAAVASLHDELARYEALGLLDEDGCLDEEKYDAYMAGQHEESAGFEHVFGELRAALHVGTPDVDLVMSALDRLRDLSPERAEREVEAYVWHELSTKLGRSMYELKRLKRVRDWAYKLIESNNGVPDVLHKMAIGHVFYKWHEADLHKITGESVSADLLSWEFVVSLDSGLEEGYKLNPAHRDAIWDAIDAWAREHGDSSDR